MYELTIVQFIKTLTNLNTLLDKAAAYADHKKFDVSILLHSRLAPDQFHLIRQVQIATDTAKGMAARVIGQEPPKFEDTETTLSEVKARINKTIDFLSTIKKEQTQGWENRMVPIGFMKGKGVIASEFVPQMALPNFYFHVVTVYSILRHNGVDIGKMDYLGTINFRDL